MNDSATVNAQSKAKGENSEIDCAQQEATQIRNEEHATYLQASSDYKQSADAVQRAMAVLAEYYGKSVIHVIEIAKKKVDLNFDGKFTEVIETWEKKVDVSWDGKHSEEVEEIRKKRVDMTFDEKYSEVIEEIRKMQTAAYGSSPQSRKGQKA